MKLITLTQEQFTQVDDWNYEWLNQWKWFAHKNHSDEYYAKRSVSIKGKKHIIVMHQLILNTPQGFDSDHRNRNTLDNQEHNLRVCTNSQNQYNKKAWGGSKYKGVHFYQNRYVAQIQINKKKMYLGRFKTEEEAARTYDKKALELFGEFSNLNFKLNEE